MDIYDELTSENVEEIASKVKNLLEKGEFLVVISHQGTEEIEPEILRGISLRRDVRNPVSYDNDGFLIHTSTIVSVFSVLRLLLKDIKFSHQGKYPYLSINQVIEERLINWVFMPENV